MHFHPYGHKIPLAVREGLCYMDMRAPTDDELAQLPHVLMTSDDPWDPQSLDSDPDDLHFFNLRWMRSLRKIGLNAVMIMRGYLMNMN